MIFTIPQKIQGMTAYCIDINDNLPQFLQQIITTNKFISSASPSIGLVHIGSTTLYGESTLCLKIEKINTTYNFKAYESLDAMHLNEKEVDLFSYDVTNKLIYGFGNNNSLEQAHSQSRILLESLTQSENIVIKIRSCYINRDIMDKVVEAFCISKPTVSYGTSVRLLEVRYPNGHTRLFTNGTIDLKDNPTISHVTPTYVPRTTGIQWKDIEKETNYKITLPDHMRRKGSYPFKFNKGSRLVLIHSNKLPEFQTYIDKFALAQFKHSLSNCISRELAAYISPMVKTKIMALTAQKNISDPTNYVRYQTSRADCGVVNDLVVYNEGEVF